MAQYALPEYDAALLTQSHALAAYFEATAAAAGNAKAASNWARQMRIFILEDMGESQAAAVLLGGLLESGEVTDAAEIRFLTQRLEALKYDEKSSPLSKSR